MPRPFASCQSNSLAWQLPQRARGGCARVAQEAQRLQHEAVLPHRGEERLGFFRRLRQLRRAAKSYSLRPPTAATGRSPSREVVRGQGRLGA